MDCYIIKTVDSNRLKEAFELIDYHRKGIATKLFSEIIEISKSNNVDKIKLNSSPYAIAFYKSIGFIPTDTEQIRNGIRYTPMELIL